MSLPRPVEADSYLKDTCSRIIPFPVRMNHPGPGHLEDFPEFLPFSDLRYLLCLISHLKKERVRQEVSVAKLAAKAGISRKVIDQAERDAIIPGTGDFKAWAAALGFTWEEVWTACLPG